MMPWRVGLLVLAATHLGCSKKELDNASRSDRHSGDGGDSGLGVDEGADLALQAMIDDLDDGDGSIRAAGGRAGFWYVFDDGSEGVTTPAENFVPTAVGDDTGGYAATLQGSGFSKWGSGMGFDLHDPSAGACNGTSASSGNTYDGSRFSGFTLLARGNVSIRVAVTTAATLPTASGGTCSGACYDHFGRDVALTDDWKRYVFRFDRLSQQNWGDDAVFDPSGMVGITFSVGSNEDYRFSVDDIAFFGAEDIYSSSMQGSGSTTGIADVALAVGMRASPYLLEQAGLSFDDHGYLGDVGTRFAANFPEAVPSALWIVGEVVLRSPQEEDDGACKLNFPAPAHSYQKMQFQPCDSNEAALDHFDSLGYMLWLQVEPGLADVEDLIDVVLSRYGHHPSVIGFAVDVEWYNTATDDGGSPVSDAVAASWVRKVRSYNPHYSLLLKHWETRAMPTSYRDGVVFVSDAQGASSEVELVSSGNSFDDWAAAFGDAMIGYQVGYASDHHWWSTMGAHPSDGPALLGKYIIDRYRAGVLKAIFWVDETMQIAFPSEDLAQR